MSFLERSDFEGEDKILNPLGSVDCPQNIDDFARMSEFAYEYSPVFWGVDIEKNGRLLPQSEPSKLKLLRETILLIPDLSFRVVARIEDDPIDIKSIEAMQKSTSSVSLPIDISSKFKKVPQTALDAVKSASIYELLHEKLTFEADPSLAVVNAYEEYLINNEVEEKAKVLGNRCLRLFAFWTGGSDYLSEIKEANLLFHAAELKRRELSTTALRYNK